MNLGRMSMCSFPLEGRYLTESFLHLLVSQGLGRMHGFCRLADFGAGICKAGVTTSGQNRISILGLKVDIPIQRSGFAR